MKEAIIVTIYYKGTCNSSKKAIQWFDNHYIEYKKYKICEITLEDLLDVLSMTDKGFTDIIKRQMSTDSVTRKKIQILQDLSFEEGLSYIKKNSEMLRTPIIVSKNKFLIGYNSEEIRQFISTNYRKKLH